MMVTVEKEVTRPLRNLRRSYEETVEVSIRRFPDNSCVVGSG